jgi:hypothetical protein
MTSQQAALDDYYTGITDDLADAISQVYDAYDHVAKMAKAKLELIASFLKARNIPMPKLAPADEAPKGAQVATPKKERAPTQWSRYGT